MDDQATIVVENLVEKLLEIGGRTNNATLRHRLGWDTEEYFAARNHGRALGLIGLARGRGGIVFLTDTARAGLGDPAQNAQDADPAQAAEIAYESEYYKKLLPTIRSAWVQSEGYDDFVVEVTASKRVKGAGRWTVPDIVVIGKIVRQYVPGFEFTVQSIEVKRFEAIDALAVFEALNHRRASHFTYLLVVNFPAKPKDKDQERMGQISQLCEEHDVNLVVVNRGDEAKYDNWDFPIEARKRADPDPYNLDGFIKQYLSAESKDAVAKMVR